MEVAITRFSRYEENLGRLTLLAAEHSEGLDATDELTVTCYEDLIKGEYLVWRDLQGMWHEHIVDTLSRSHDDSGRPITTATCINSVNETWDDYITDKRPRGTVTVALTSILADTRWEVGPCTQLGEHSHTYYHKSVREGIAETVETWGGELLTVIDCDGSRVTRRRLAIVSARGNQSSHKRFTWTKDIISIARDFDGENPKTRIYAYGKGEEIEETGGYGRRIGIEDVNGGIPYVEDAAATAIWGHIGPQGTVIPASGIYISEQCEDPQQLLDEALEYLDRAKEPRVTYTADVIDLYAFGREWEGVGLGDLVTIIDKEFSEDGITLQGRVSKIERDLLTDDTTVTFGTLVDAIATPWHDLQAKVASLSGRSANWDQISVPSSAWLTTFMTQLNAQYDAAGTYHFSSFEQGEIWSNVPLDQDGKPTRSGGWAMNINGLGFRLANSTNADGSWYWRAFGNGNGFTADEFVAGVIRGGSNYWNLNTGDLFFDSGSISTSSGSSYWDLDSGDFVLSDQRQNDPDYFKFADMQISDESGWLNGITSTQTVRGVFLGDIQDPPIYENDNFLALAPNLSDGNSGHEAVLLSRDDLKIMRFGDYSYTSRAGIALGGDGITLNVIGKNWNGDSVHVLPGISVGRTKTVIGTDGTEDGEDIITVEDYRVTTASGAYSPSRVICRSPVYLRNDFQVTNSTGDTVFRANTSGGGSIAGGFSITGEVSSYIHGTYGLYVQKRAVIDGGLAVSGTKNRKVATKDYGKRLLYCYETPAPYFGDLGSGTIGEDGLCYVEIDDIFTETARTDMGYQVFLQKCGQGDLWVSEKHPAYFVVEGTPGLAFDWEMKCHQTGYETERMEEDDQATTIGDEMAYGKDVEDAYGDLGEYIESIERTYQEVSDEAAE